MRRRFLLISIGMMVAIGTFLSTSSIDTAWAVGKNTQLENEKKKVQEKRSDVKSEMNEKEYEISSLQGEQAKLEADIKRLDISVAETNAKMREKEAEIAVTQEEIQLLQAQILEVAERIKKRDALLEERMRSIQESGGVVSYIDVLLGAQNFGDFIDRLSALSTFVQADKDIIKTHQEDKLLKEKKEEEVTVHLANLENQLTSLEAMKVELNKHIKEKNEIMSQLKKQEEEIHSHLEELEDEEKLLAAQEAAIKKEIKAWEKRQREIEEARKKGQTPKVTDGNFMNPTTGRLTSGYGHRWGSLHAGVDIANRSANVPVVAAAAGTVFRSYYSSSYGNVVFITHNINGQIYTTVYAHLESRNVSEGQSVDKGTRIGYMGNTGRSYGKHLHFEIHKGPWNNSKSNSVDPRKYINF
ncbi:peptidoglycan DD-metalloendopeptidase family protein [Bacillus luteolus]|uniref:Peptidoglycan DD-metalloendopeptidase family protein n=1 Tax=Litchfieldia luteola TaxID=682179 RepID=A0ABR9QFL2_9BACI|nr:peptidoglycan DD-metalloendopeptidase family protein [Cytobacillus luteolus]MBE4907034.1 peptidoglycan DD-metalloendopeptidase family protein [Cytobacillus luteolus]MBP1943499.1 peptidoglycan hydrolase CwlO-like protein [Cytobacillus luteolus]